MYSIIDVETTGGKFNQEGITEIAIYKFDGENIVDQFISLINPEIPIQPFVQQLTGITDKMVSNAPKFFQVAKRILEKVFKEFDLVKKVTVSVSKVSPPIDADVKKVTVKLSQKRGDRSL